MEKNVSTHQTIDHEAAAWLRLVLTPGVGPVTACKLLQRFKAPEGVLTAPFSEVAAITSEKIAHALRAGDPQRAQQVDLTLEWAKAPGHHLITLADPDYPWALLSIGDPPPVLYARGDRAALAWPAVAVVGSRNATVTGCDTARGFAEVLSRAGFAVTSGLALGIDAAAHEGALAGPTPTVAVVGTGVDRVYPAAHAALARRIMAQGLLLSELPLGTRASVAAFPRRNRLIAGLSRAVLVVEAALHSGSLITARQAAEFGRDVLAIPGSIHSPLARGCHALIKQGARLVDSAEDLLHELGHDGVSSQSGHSGRVSATTRFVASAHSHVESRLEAGRPPSLSGIESPAQATLLAAVGHDPVSADRLASSLGWPVSAVTATLLELAGLVKSGSDGRVIRVESN